MRARTMLGRLFAGKTHRRTRRNNVRLCLETLDERINPFGDNVWIGPEGGVWSDPANWSLGRAPTTGDTLHFGQDQYGYGANTSSYDDIPNVTVGEIDTAGFTATINIGLYGGEYLGVTNDF